MRRLRRFTFLGLVTFVLGSVSASTQVLTLDDALKAAESNNRRIRIAEFEREKSYAQLSVASGHTGCQPSRSPL